MTYLESRAVAPATAQEYLRRYRHFKEWTTLHGLALDSHQKMDAGIADYMNHQYVEGSNALDASKLLAAIGHFESQYSRYGKAKLPRAIRCIQAFRKANPPKSRLPLPYLGLMAMIGAALHRNHGAFALYLLLAFVCYPRPGELLSLTPGQLIAPVENAGEHANSWAILLSPFEEGKAGKTGEFDESLRIDWPELKWLHPLLRMIARLPPNQKVWPFAERGIHDLYMTSASDAGITQLGSTPYCLRHGGASHDALTGRRTLSEIKDRGRWLSDKSLRRYKKAAAAQKQLVLMGPAAVDYGKWVDDNLEMLMIKAITPHLLKRLR